MTASREETHYQLIDLASRAEAHYQLIDLALREETHYQLIDLASREETHYQLIDFSIALVQKHTTYRCHPELVSGSKNIFTSMPDVKNLFCPS